MAYEFCTEKWPGSNIYFSSNKCLSFLITSAVCCGHMSKIHFWRALIGLSFMGTQKSPKFGSKKANALKYPCHKLLASLI